MQSPSDNEIFDVTVIGGGPTGLAASYYAGHRDATVRIIDSLPELGGQVRAVYPEKTIFDVAGHPEIQAAAFCDLMQQQGLQFGADVVLDETCSGLEQFTKHDDGSLTPIAEGATADDVAGDQLVMRLTGATGTEYWTRTLIIAGGHGAFEPRKLRIDDIERWEGNGLHYVVRQKATFADKRVVIVGGGDSALDWTLGLQDTISSPLTLVHRRDAFRGLETSEKQMRDLATSGAVDLRVPCEVTAIHGNGHVQAVTITDRDAGTDEVVECDELVTLLGFKSALGPIGAWNLEMAGRRKVAVDNTTMLTSRPNIYAAGDIAGYPNKITLITIDMGEAAIAANHALTTIRPDARIQPAYSTE